MTRISAVVAEGFPPEKVRNRMAKFWKKAGIGSANRWLERAKASRLGCAHVGVCPPRPKLKRKNFFARWDASYILYQDVQRSGYELSPREEWTPTGRDRIIPAASETQVIQKLLAGEIKLSDIHGINFFLTDKSRVKKKIPNGKERKFARRMLVMWRGGDDITVGDLQDGTSPLRSRYETTGKFFRVWGYPYTDVFCSGVPPTFRSYDCRFREMEGNWYIELWKDLVHRIPKHGYIDVESFPRTPRSWADLEARWSDNPTNRRRKTYRVRIIPVPREERNTSGNGFWIENGKIYFAKIPVWDKNPEEIVAGQGSKQERRKRKKLLARARKAVDSNRSKRMRSR